MQHLTKGVMMKEKLISEINKIRKNSSFLILDEASIKSGVIQNFLSLLGWNPFDVDEVKPEYTVGPKRVDFSLRINGTNKVFIEVKRPNENLEPHQEQLLEYSFREGVKIALLTNGSTWWFYLPLHERSWEERRFFTADFFEQEPAIIAERFIDLLSKENVSSGDALKNAEHLYTSHQKIQILKDTLPKAWHKIINDPDDLLIDLLIETTEKMCGFRPAISDIEKFLGNMQPDTSSKTGVINTTAYPNSAAPIHLTSLTGDYINKKVQHFVLLGKTYHPHTWKDLLVTVSEEMYRRHTTEFDRCLRLRGSRMAYFSQNSNELKVPAQISNSKFFVETKLNANSIVRRSHELMALFGYKGNDLVVVAT